MEIRRALDSDVNGMAKCHIESFPGYPMTEMGVRWMESLYRHYIQHPEGISFVAIDELGQVVGLAVGGRRSGIRDEFMKKAVWRYFYLFPIKFFSSSLLRHKLFDNLSSKLSKNRDNSHTDLSPLDDEAKELLRQSGSLLSICVAKNVGVQMLPLF